MHGTHRPWTINTLTHAQCTFSLKLSHGQFARHFHTAIRPFFLLTFSTHFSFQQFWNKKKMYKYGKGLFKLGWMGVHIFIKNTKQNYVGMSNNSLPSFSRSCPQVSIFPVTPLVILIHKSIFWYGQKRMLFYVFWRSPQREFYSATLQN